MNFGQTKVLSTHGQLPRKSGRANKSQIAIKSYSHILHMYKTIPDSVISLEKFEKLAMYRYRVLLAMDSLAATNIKFSEEWYKKLESRLVEVADDKIDPKKETITDEVIKLGSFMKSQPHHSKLHTKKLQEEILNDHWSHQILKLAYSRTEENRKWFLEHEVDLFKFRMKKQLSTGNKVLSIKGYSKHLFFLNIYSSVGMMLKSTSSISFLNSS